jgi:DNA-binding NarL/FixJ family response regulator
VVSLLTHSDPEVASNYSTTITVDYREPTPSEAWADRVKQLFDEGKLLKAIAAELGITRNMAAKALEHWYRRNGLPKPDCRSRRVELNQKQLAAPRFIQITDEVMRLYREGWLLADIATSLNCDRTTVTKAIAHWHVARGLPVPDGRSRRKLLQHLARGTAVRQATGSESPAA